MTHSTSAIWEKHKLYKYIQINRASNNSYGEKEEPSLKIDYRFDGCRASGAGTETNKVWKKNTSFSLLWDFNCLFISNGLQVAPLKQLAIFLDGAVLDRGIIHWCGERRKTGLVPNLI